MHPGSSHPADDDFVRTLVEDTSEVNRAKAHYELGKLAKARQQPEKAAAHFQEAFDLDPTDEHPLVELRAMGVTPALGSEAKPGFFGRLWAGLRKR